MFTKICKICKTEKEISEYSKHPTAKYGVSNTCRECARELTRTYRKNNIDKYRERDRERNQTEHRKTQSKEWESRNREKRREQERARDAANRVEVNKKQQIWRVKNPEKDKANSLRWREKNRESLREKARVYGKTYRITNYDKVVASVHRYRKRVKENGGTFTGADWSRIKGFYNHTCLACGKQEPEITLSPDHVIPISKGGANDATNIQPLCRRCNRIKSDKDTDYRVLPLPPFRP